VTRYLFRRLLLAIPTLFAISVLSFAVIELPPGDYLDQKVVELEQIMGDASSRARAEHLRHRYGLDQPVYVRYLKWAGGFVHGDFGESFRYEREVKDLIWERLGYTLLVSIGSMFFIYLTAIPLGILGARHARRAPDHALTAFSLLGISLPGFLLALGAIVLVFRITGIPLYGLQSPAWQDQPFSGGKAADFLEHLWIPVVVIGLSGGAGLARIMRSNLLEVLGEPFVRTARAGGLPERVVLRHAARLALNPLVSMLGMSLPDVLSGTTIVSVVLGLPTLGPLLLQALLDQDMYLAGTILTFMAILLVIGNLLADLALAWLDPRTRGA
jgi:peptide/nickel transport system permease protein